MTMPSPSYGYPPQMPPPRKRHTARNVTLIITGALAVIIAASVAISAGKPPAPAGSTSVSAATPAATPAAQPAATSAPAAVPTTVRFIVTGTGQPSITWGSDSDNRDGGGTLGQLGDGNALPWHGSLRFDPSAQFYSIDAQLEGGGDITCKIIVTGPGIVPLVVSRGHAQGGDNICSAQATSPDGGVTWQNEG